MSECVCAFHTNLYNSVYAWSEIVLHLEFLHTFERRAQMDKSVSARSEKEKRQRVRTKKLPFTPGLAVYAYHTTGR